MNRLVAIPFVAIALLLSGCTSCGGTKNGEPVVLRPGALSVFDQQAYETLMVAQGSLKQARTEVRDNYPQYKDQFNKVAAAYNTAQAAYKVYHEGATDTPEAQAKVRIAIVEAVGQLSGLLAKLGVGVGVASPPVEVIK